jgi:hypothetical protein
VQSLPEEVAWWQDVPPTAWEPSSTARTVATRQPFYVLTPTGIKERKYIYGNEWEEVNNKRIELLENNRKGVPSIASSMKLGDYLDY